MGSTGLSKRCARELENRTRLFGRELQTLPSKAESTRNKPLQNTTMASHSCCNKCTPSPVPLSRELCGHREYTWVYKAMYKLAPRLCQTRLQIVGGRGGHNCGTQQFQRKSHILFDLYPTLNHLWSD